MFMQVECADGGGVLQSGGVVALAVGQRLGAAPQRRVHQRLQVRDKWRTAHLPVGHAMALTWNIHTCMQDVF